MCVRMNQIANKDATMNQYHRSHGIGSRFMQDETRTSSPSYAVKRLMDNGRIFAVFYFVMQIEEACIDISQHIT